MVTGGGGAAEEVRDSRTTPPGESPPRAASYTPVIARVKVDPEWRDAWLEGKPIYAAGNGPYIGTVVATGETDGELWAEVELTPEASGQVNETGVYSVPQIEEDPFG